VETVTVSFLACSQAGTSLLPGLQFLVAVKTGIIMHLAD
jgi:hypothetical protein